MTMSREFGLLIRDLRKRAGLTQTQLALEIGTSQMAVSVWETGKNMPSRRIVNELCKSFPEHEEELRMAWAYAKLEVAD